MMATQTRTLFAHALLFVLGFSLVFIVGWGGAVTMLGQLFGQYKSMLSQAGGYLSCFLGCTRLGFCAFPGWITIYDRNGHLAKRAASFPPD